MCQKSCPSLLPARPVSLFLHLSLSIPLSLSVCPPSLSHTWTLPTWWTLETLLSFQEPWQWESSRDLFFCLWLWSMCFCWSLHSVRVCACARACMCATGLCLVSGDFVLDDAVGLMAVVTWKADIFSTPGGSLSQFERIGAIFQMTISPLIKLRNSKAPLGKVHSAAYH